MSEAGAGETLAGTVARIAGEILRCDPPPGLETGPADHPRWNSYATVEMIFAVEDRFGFQMTGAEMERIGSVADLVEIVRAHGIAA